MEAQHRRLAVALAGREHGRGELRLVHGVGEALRLEAHGAEARAGAAALAALAAEVLAGVELQAGLRGQDLERAPRARLAQEAGARQRSGGLRERVVHVVAARGTGRELAQARTDRTRRAE